MPLGLLSSGYSPSWISRESGQLIAFVDAAMLGGLLSGYIGSIFESVGDYGAACSACKKVYQGKHIDRGIIAEGLGCVITAFFGALPYPLTPKTPALWRTGAAFRRVTQVAGLPKPITSVVFLITAASITFSGIDTLVFPPRTLRN